MEGNWIGADAPLMRGARLPWRAYAWAVSMVVIVTLLNHLLFGRVGEANLIITYLLGILPVALRGDRGAAVGAAVASVAAFDLFFVLPYHTLAVSDAQYLYTFAVMGIVGGVISTLTARLAAEISETRRREKHSRELYELSQSLFEARSQAEAERLRNTLLSSVSHDLRTPLTGIVGAASSLVDGAEALPPDARRELAAGIVEEGERLNRLVTNMLNATRLDAGGIRLQREWTSLEDLLAPAIARLSGALASHALTIELPGELPLLHVDAVMMEQAFGNLLENAAKHTPPGTALALRASQQGDRLLVSLTDEGPGLPPGAEQRVFEKFWGAGERGAGLGLSIVKGVVEAHGGSVTATTRPEGGARFDVELPIAAPPSRRAPEGAGA